MTSTDAHLAQIAQFSGPFPSGFLARCEKRDEYFDGNGEYFSDPMAMTVLY